MRALFGQAFDFDLYALTADEINNLILPATPGNIYLFDKRPSPEQARTNSNGDALQTVNAWVDTADGYGKRISFARVDDPNPDSEVNTDSGPYSYSDNNAYERSYWVAVNFILETGDTAPQRALLREVKLTRVWAQESKISVTVADLLRLESHLTIHCDYLGDLQNYIDTAEYRVRSLLVGCNVRWGDIVDPRQLNLCVAERALYDFLRGQSRGVGDVAENLSMMHKEEYEACLKRIYLKLDKNRDGKVEGKRNGSIPTMEFFR